MRFKDLIYIAITFLLVSCVNDIKEVDALMANIDAIYMDTAKDVRILYSDSAAVKVEITAPTLVRHLNKDNPRDEFPDGVFVQFYDDGQRVSSWLKADYAVQMNREDIVIAQSRGNRPVELFNANQEKIESPELIWDEKKEILYTDKIVRITQASTGDTTYGSGFVANQDFTRFEIKSNYSAKMNRSSFDKTLKN